MKDKWKLVISIIFALMLLFLAFSLTLHIPISPPKFNKTEIEIPHGASLLDIVDTLRKNNIVDNNKAFLLCVKILGKERSLQAGYFHLVRATNYYKLINILSHALPKEIKVTIPEGLKTEKIASILCRSIDIDSSEFINYVRSEDVAKSLKIPSTTLDGFLFPSTYLFYENEKLEDIVSRLVSQFFDVLPDNYQTICNSRGLTLREIVTMASLIEGEAMKDEERTLISAVFYNRLKKRMRLQACSTVQFLLPEPRRLLNKDLMIDSPYNTYLHYGLPPGPINNPGKASILAAFFPADVDYLYFVARGDGYHNFATTNEEFIRAKNKFQKIRRQVRRQKKGG